VIDRYLVFFYVSMHAPSVITITRAEFITNDCFIINVDCYNKSLVTQAQWLGYDRCLNNGLSSSLRHTTYV